MSPASAQVTVTTIGLTRHDIATFAALSGLCANPVNANTDADTLAEEAVEIAEALDSRLERRDELVKEANKLATEDQRKQSNN